MKQQRDHVHRPAAVSTSAPTRRLSRLLGALTALALIAQLLIAAARPGAAAAAPVVTNQPPAAPHALIAFPQRDYVSISGYQQSETLTVEIIHSAAYGGGVTTVSGLTPLDDPTTPDPNDGIVEINHPGGYCWVGQTPDIRPGDLLRVTVEQTGVADATTVANVTTKRAVQIGPNTVQIHGTAQDAGGAPIPIDQLEHRLISPGNLFDVTNKRTLRADAAGGGYGSLAYDAPGAITWTATYDNLLSADIDRALAAESAIIWLGADPAAAVEATNYEVGAGIAAGPAAPCSAPLEPLPPPPGSELLPPTVPGTPSAVVTNSNTVTLSWAAATDNVGVTSYGVYRNGQPIANVQNPDGSVDPPTTYVDANVPPGTYSYTVDAADEVGNRSAQSGASGSVTAVAQPAGNLAVNEPPANGHAILAFPSRDFISAQGYADSSFVDVQIIRAGFVVASSAGSPIDGLVEINHPGGYCWAGVTPELRAGDIIRTIEYAVDLSTILSVDQVTVANVVANKAVQTGPGSIAIHGYAQAADGSPIPIDQLEQRMVASSKDPFNINGRRTIRADAAGAGEGTISYDAESNPTGTKWTATYTGLDQHDIDLALSVESRVLWLGRDPLAGIEITLFETGLLDPPGPSPAFCTAPLSGADLAAPSAPSLSATPDGAARSVGLSWSAASDDTAVYGYLISRDGQPLRYVGADALGYIDTDVAPGAHSYRVQAFDSASPRGAGPTIIEQLQAGQGQRYGNLSAASNAVGVTMPDVTAPSVPANLTATITNTSYVDLTWDAAIDDIAVAAYGIYRDGGLIATVPGNTTSLTDGFNGGAGLAPGVYSYTVDAADAAGNRSAQSPAVSVTITAVVDSAPPSVPADVQASVPNVRARDIVVSWSAAADNVAVSGYTLYRDGAAIATLNAGTLSYADTSRPAGTYAYSVAAFDSAGNRSAQSASRSAAVANDPPANGHSVIPFPARDFVSADGYMGEGPVVISVLRGGVTVYRSDPITPDSLTGLAEVNHPGGQCWAISTPDIRPGDIVRATNGAGVPDQTVVVGVSAERPIQINATTVVIHGVAIDESGARLPIDQVESRLVTSTANAFELNGRRVLRADAAGAVDGTLSYDSPGSASWTATYTGLSAADVARALGAESQGHWLGRAPLAGNEATIYENGPGTDGGPSAGFCDGAAGSIANAPAEPSRPVASWAPAGVAFGDQSAVPATASAARSISLNNISPTTMAISKVYLAGANPGDFTITASSCGASLAPLASCSVSVTFAPQALGARSASLNFLDNAANTTFQSVALSGNGTDTAAPNAPGAPTQAIALGASVSATSIPVTVSWGASGGAAGYELQRSTNNGAFTNVALANPALTSAVVSLAPGASYAFRVRACSASGNCSAYAAGASRALAVAQENLKAVSLSGSWTNQAIAGAFGGAVRWAQTSKEKAQYKFTATSVYWVTTMGPNYGRASVSVDGGPATVIDLYAPARQTAVVKFSVDGLTAGRSHQIVVQVLGQRNPLSTSNRVDVDGFITIN